MVSLGGSFFTKDGIVPDENLLKKQIYDELKVFVTAGLSKKVSGLLEVLRMECCVESLPIQEDRIHVANGTYFMDGNRVSSELAQNERLYNVEVEATNNVHVGGKRVRGFVGIEVVNPLPY